MKKALFPLAGAFICVFMIAGAEAVVAYPHPSWAASTFFETAFTIYLPIGIAWASLLFAIFGRRGLDLWLPLSLGMARVAGHVSAAGGSTTLWISVAVGAAVLAW